MAKRDAILDAAETVFTQDGDAASMDRVAEVGGVSKQTIYKHYRHPIPDQAVRRRVGRLWGWIRSDSCAASSRPRSVRVMILRRLSRGSSSACTRS